MELSGNCNIPVEYIEEGFENVVLVLIRDVGTGV